MAEFTLAHVGVNVGNPEEALDTAKAFHLLFDFPIKTGNSSIFAGTGIEVMKEPYKGSHGHIGIGTQDVDAAKTELEAKGFAFDKLTAKHAPDGTLNAIYLKGEICGFAIHLVKI